jgi:hypothetical protein
VHYCGSFIPSVVSCAPHPRRAIRISSRGAGGISFLFCRQVPSFECSSSASWLVFSYFVLILVVYPQSQAELQFGISYVRISAKPCQYFISMTRQEIWEKECCLEYRVGFRKHAWSFFDYLRDFFLLWVNVHYFVCNKLYPNVDLHTPHYLCLYYFGHLYGPVYGEVSWLRK